MRRHPGILVVAALALVSIAVAPAGAARSDATRARAAIDYVRGDAQFHRAVWRMRRAGGTIVLRPGVYRRLVVTTRPWPRLRIVGMRGVRVERILFDGARRISFGRAVVAPVTRDALVEVRRSRGIEIHDIVVTAQRTRHSASVLVSAGRDVAIRRSRFTHCGDRAPQFTNCVQLYRWAHRVLIEDNRFHDCLGCDFVHGRFGSDLTIRRNRFARSLPCRINPHRCGHQDLVGLYAGRRLRVIGNRFGVYRQGGAQLYLTNNVDYVTIANNLFVGIDRRVPSYRARMGIIVGSAESKRLPHYVKVVNNTILTGFKRRDGYAGSIRMSSLYGRVPRWKRPIVENNVIALFKKTGHVCSSSQRFIHNVVLNGRGCSASDHVGYANLDSEGRPTAWSVPLIDRGNRRYAPKTDITGRPRDGRPDIGAFEYRG